MSGKPRGLMKYLRRRPNQVAADVDEELTLHLELRAQELQGKGLTADAARREALRQFGDLEETRRYCRRMDEARDTTMQRMLMLQDFAQDARIGLRGLIRAPIVSLAILATVGLGIGATTAIFGAVDAALLRPLPYVEPERLVRIYNDMPPFKFPLSAVDYLAIEAQQTQFERTATYTDRTMTFTDGETADVLNARVVSVGFFRVLGRGPLMGRDFSDEDGRAGGPGVVIVGHGFWQQRLGGRPDVVGRTMRLDGSDYTVVGVLPQRVGPLEQRRDVFVAQQFAPPPRRGPFFFTVIARLPSGRDPAVAEAELREINRRIFPIWKASYQDEKATWSLMPLDDHIVGDIGRTAVLALAAVALVWVIACANASSLLVARVTSRRRELAVRAALGASRGRVVRYLLAESAVLAAGSVAVGSAIAAAGVQAFRGAGASYLPRMQEVSLDGRVLGLMVVLAVASALMFGLIPALHGASGPVDESLRSEGRSSTGAAAVRRLRRLLVGTQFAVATPLLVIAGLLLVSLNELRRVDLGFDGRQVITGLIRLPPQPYADQARATVFWDELVRRVGALPGVAGAALADDLPPDNVGNINNFDLEEFPTPPGQSQPATPWIAVTPEYFRVLGLSLLEGRLLEDADARRENLEAVVVDRAWARRFFPGQSAVGKRFREGGCTTCPWTAVVGVVSEVKYVGLGEPDQGTVYWPMAGQLSRHLVVRARTGPQSVWPAVRSVVKELDASAPVTRVATVAELVEEALEGPRSLSMLVASFAAVALLLSVLGIYAVMAFYVQQHVKEIGIRMALGGRARDVMGLVIGQGMRVVVLGVGVGLLGSVGLARLTSSFLFGIGATDAFTFAVVTTTLVAVAFVACFIPARRAVGVPLAEALRVD